MAALLSLSHVTKAFPGVRALDGVTFDVHPGECHALVGENGAGKSTLLKILGGIIPSGEFEGELRIDGAVARLAGVADAEAAGIAVVHQELSLVGPLSVAENIALGHEPRRGITIDRRQVRARAAGILASLHAPLDPDVPVERLGVGAQQLVEIAKALSRDARILVLDEPTAALTDADAGVLLERLDRLRRRGIAIVYVSHRLAEVLRASDRVTVLRDGRSVATSATAAVDEAWLVSAMVGRSVEALFHRSTRAPGAVVLAARGLTVDDPGVPGRRLLDGVDLEVRAGEIVGVSGLMGAGRTTLLSSLFGAPPGPVRGEILVDGTSVRLASPRDAIAHGIAMLPEDRARLGLLLEESLASNVTLASLGRFARRGVTDAPAERRAALEAMENLGIRASSPESRVGTLSGGNQQKVLAARWLLTRPRVLLLDEPTRGVDIGAREELYGVIDRLAARGLAVLVVSSDLTEVLGLSDRVIVLRQGRVAGGFTREAAHPEAIMAAATGTVHSSPWALGPFTVNSDSARARAALHHRPRL